MADDDDLAAVTVARAAQLAALTGMAAEHAVRRRTRHEHDRSAAHEAAQRATAAHRLAAHAAARTVYGEAYDPAWARHAGTLAAARVWNAAAPWAGDDPAAAGARHRAEQRLTQLHPAAMAHYRQRRNTGLDPLAAMRDTVGRFVADPTAHQQALTGPRHTPDGVPHDPAREPGAPPKGGSPPVVDPDATATPSSDTKAAARRATAVPASAAAADAHPADAVTGPTATSVPGRRRPPAAHR
jgi:hypothetical protein